MNDQRPIIGCQIIEFSDSAIADYNIIGGYGVNYLLAERRGVVLAESKEVKFIEDQTVFKGTGRYDGLPTAGKAFVAVGYNNVAPVLTHTFPPAPQD